MATVNIDAKLLKDNSFNNSENIQMAQLENGCICCSISDDMCQSILDLANEKNFDHIIVECSGIAEPRNIREMFQSDPRLQDKVYLDTLVSVIDVPSFLQYFGTSETLENNTKLYIDNNQKVNESLRGISPPTPSEGLRASITDLLLEQAECADILLLSKIDLLSSDSIQRSVELDTVTNILQQLNPTSSVLHCLRGGVDPALVIGAKKGLGAASKTMFFDQRSVVESIESHVNALGEDANCSICDSLVHHHKRTTAATRFNISSFVYKRRRPFHPTRLAAFLTSLGQLSRPNVSSLWSMANNLDSPYTNIADNEKNSALDSSNRLSKDAVNCLLRSKGFLWVAFSHENGYYLSHAGKFLDISEFGVWWDSVPRDEWPPSANATQQILMDFKLPYGDRRQEIVFIGQFGDNNDNFSSSRYNVTNSRQDLLIRTLDDCLLTNEELSMYDKCVRKGGDALCDAFIET